MPKSGNLCVCVIFKYCLVNSYSVFLKANYVSLEFGDVPCWLLHAYNYTKCKACVLLCGAMCVEEVESVFASFLHTSACWLPRQTTIHSTARILRPNFSFTPLGSRLQTIFDLETDLDYFFFFFLRKVIESCTWWQWQQLERITRLIKKSNNISIWNDVHTAICVARWKEQSWLLEWLKSLWGCTCLECESLGTTPSNIFCLHSTALCQDKPTRVLNLLEMTAKFPSDHILPLWKREDSLKYTKVRNDYSLNAFHRKFCFNYKQLYTIEL